MIEPYFCDEEELLEAVERRLEYWEEKLNETDRRVLAFVMWREGAWDNPMSVDNLAEEIGRSTHSVQRSIKKLRNCGMIELDKNSRAFYFSLQEREGER